MKLTLEFLQTDADIDEFIHYLYEHNFSISYRRGEKQHIELDQVAAVHVLQHDLYTIWGAYYIGNSACRKILMFDSCGPQAHPSKLGKQGRAAGRIAHIDKNDPTEKDLFRLLRNYFRRNYQFLRYNGAARMSCYFGPRYLEMEECYFSASQTCDLCVGYLHLVCHPSRVEKEEDRIAWVLEKLNVQSAQMFVRQFWEDRALSEFHVPFLYDSACFSPERYFPIVSTLSPADYPVRFYSEILIAGFRNHILPGKLVHNSEINSFDMRFQMPWYSLQ